VEYPTYPYDFETSKEHIKYKPIFFLNRLFRKGLKGSIDRVVTFTNIPEIEGVETINISNAIDFASVNLSQREEEKKGVFNLLGVAEIHFWHGYDRVIQGLFKYYKSDGIKKEVHFHIVGDGCEKDNIELKELTAKLGMSKYVHFHGNKRSDELDSFFELADFCIASLAKAGSIEVVFGAVSDRSYAMLLIVGGDESARAFITDDFINARDLNNGLAIGCTVGDVSHQARCFVGRHNIAGVA
jgi:hypothetical protein